MTEITITRIGLCAACGVWLLIGMCVGSWLQERWGADDANAGGAEEE